MTEDVIGSWKLVSYMSRTIDGATLETFGTAPKGIAVFDATGLFTISIVRSDLAPFASNNRGAGTAAENAAVVQGSIAYFGHYSFLDEGRGLAIDIVGATLPNWMGTRQMRKVAMPSRDRLVLVNLAASGGGVAEVAWERARERTWR